MKEVGGEAMVTYMESFLMRHVKYNLGEKKINKKNGGGRRMWVVVEGYG